MNGTGFEAPSESNTVQWTDVAALTEVPEGISGHRVGTTQLVLVRVADLVHATEALCPHKFAALEDGTLVDGCIRCPQHEAHFDPQTGNPGEGEEWAGKLATYPTRVVDGVVQVQID